jgi:hypothetical protein
MIYSVEDYRKRCEKNKIENHNYERKEKGRNDILFQLIFWKMNILLKV